MKHRNIPHPDDPRDSARPSVLEGLAELASALVLLFSVCLIALRTQDAATHAAAMARPLVGLADLVMDDRDSDRAHHALPLTAVCPRRCSMTGFHGTRLISNPSSRMAQRHWLRRSDPRGLHRLQRLRTRRAYRP